MAREYKEKKRKERDAERRSPKGHSLYPTKHAFPDKQGTAEPLTTCSTSLHLLLPHLSSRAQLLAPPAWGKDNLKEKFLQKLKRAADKETQVNSESLLGKANAHGKWPHFFPQFLSYWIFSHQALTFKPSVVPIAVMVSQGTGLEALLAVSTLTGKAP